MHLVAWFGTPKDIASVMEILASDEAGFISGQIYAMEGGRVAVRPYLIPPARSKPCGWGR